MWLTSRSDHRVFRVFGCPLTKGTWISCRYYSHKSNRSKVSAFNLILRNSSDCRKCVQFGLALLKEMHWELNNIRRTPNAKLAYIDRTSRWATPMSTLRFRAWNGVTGLYFWRIIFSFIGCIDSRDMTTMRDLKNFQAAVKNKKEKNKTKTAMHSLYVCYNKCPEPSQQLRCEIWLSIILTSTLRKEIHITL